MAVMEDDAAFNAGRGSKLTIMGRVEMDAAIMEGLGMRAGKYGKQFRMWGGSSKTGCFAFILKMLCSSFMLGAMSSSQFVCSSFKIVMWFFQNCYAVLPKLFCGSSKLFSVSSKTVMQFFQNCYAVLPKLSCVQPCNTINSD